MLDWSSKKRDKTNDQYQDQKQGITTDPIETKRIIIGYSEKTILPINSIA